MLLPCPHCKKRFTLSTERLPTGAAKLRCPACKGLFVVDTAPLRRVPSRTPESSSPRRPPTPPSEARPAVESPRNLAPMLPGTPPPEAESPRKAEEPARSPWLRFWFLLPVAGVLVALIGILVPAFWKTPTGSVRQTGPNEPSLSWGLPSPVPVRTSEPEVEDKSPGTKVAKEKAAIPAETPLSYRSLWPFSLLGKEESCAHLAHAETGQTPGKGADPCGVYSPWIAYLSLEASPVPACNLDGVFVTATDAIGQGKLCGRGYAFLSVYYSYKKLPDRSRSFLEQALQISPKDPWVRLAEAVVRARDLRDTKGAAQILEDLLRREPSFSLAQYHLARICIIEEEYGKAQDLFVLLEKTFPAQPRFSTLQQTLASIEQAPYFSAGRAKGLLKAGKVFSDLTDYPLAGKLCRKVVEEMPGTLSQGERKSAFYELGRISEITGDRETAFRCYQSALRIDPAYRDARERMGSLLKGSAHTS